MIQTQARNGVRILISLLLVAVVMGGLAVAQIRFGGPISRATSLQDELLADILPPPAFVVEPYLHATLITTNPETMAQELAQIDENRAAFRQRREYWKTAPIPDELRAELESSLTKADAFWETMDTRFLPAAKAGDIARANAIRNAELGPRFSAQHDQIEQLVAASNRYRATLVADGQRTTVLAIAVVALLAAAIMALVLIAGRLIGSRIVAPLADTAKAIEALAAGDFQRTIDGQERQDEIGTVARAMETFRQGAIAKTRAEEEQRQVVRALSDALDHLADKDLEYTIEETFPAGYEQLRHNFNRAQDSLRGAIGTVRVSARGVLASITEIRAAADDLARRNEQQAANLEETAAAMNQVTGSVSATAAGAVAVQQSIALAHGEALEGGRVVEQAVAAMAQIEESAQQIAQIISVIDGIAFQTNLLALNAGVEAARAGEAGKGFAVVANEVRALAQRSADASRDIRALISNSSDQVTAGVGLVGTTGTRLREIVGRIGEINTLVAEIASAAEQQAKSLQQINGAVLDMDRMTQQNAAMVEQSTAATRALNTEADCMMDLVSAFRTRDVASRSGHRAETNRRASAVASRPAQRPAAPALPAPARAVTMAPPVTGNLALARPDDDWSSF
ncbi:methyl-accepting chemotaxis protein [Novosphingobium piscinae]|uniref:HAMP domain-containing protein n=1 Tax=Novosphingobium piscinae TaxID=1507448 RepID=A0A7X1KQG8_9SPHN|nr:methyl-accepting chemotaxis protein [Novosphingobium piscinae]MBC2669747.1 HAMP domain-containing protein [Novosphingobium piscinae]